MLTEIVAQSVEEWEAKFESAAPDFLDVCDKISEAVEECGIENWEDSLEVVISEVATEAEELDEPYTGIELAYLRDWIRDRLSEIA